MWTGVKKKLAVLIFNAEAIVNPRFEQKAAGGNIILVGLDLFSFWRCH